jgi:hypothetical protein
MVTWLSFVDAARRGRAFLGAEERGHKKAFVLPQRRRRRQVEPDWLVEGTEETPLPSCLWRDSSPDHTARDLMSARKQVF